MFYFKLQKCSEQFCFKKKYVKYRISLQLKAIFVNVLF